MDWRKKELKDNDEVFIKPLLAKPRLSRRGYARGGGWERFKYFEFLRKDGMFPMTGERDEQRVAHRITSPMGWGSCEPPELPHEAVSRKGGWNGRSSALQCGVAHIFFTTRSEYPYPLGF